jgi:hypothetical protein
MSPENAIVDIKEDKGKDDPRDQEDRIPSDTMEGV